MTVKAKRLSKIRKEVEMIGTTYDNDGNIVRMAIRKKVVKIGKGGHVVLPNNLVGKEVEIIYTRYK